MRRWLVLLVVVMVLGFQGSALATITSQDRDAIRGILVAHRSPLPPWTIEAFADLHPDFDIAGYLAVMQRESGMGTRGGSAKHNNPGNIKWGGWITPGDERVWLLWMTSYWHSPGQGNYGEYSSMYWGQRAAIRLIYERYRQYFPDDMWGFASRYYGSNVAGCQGYSWDLVVIRARIVREAAIYGADWG